MYLKLIKLIKSSRSFGSLVKMYSFRKHTFTWLFSIFKHSLGVLILNYISILKSFYVSSVFQVQKEILFYNRTSKTEVVASTIFMFFSNYFHIKDNSVNIKINYVKPLTSECSLAKNIHSTYQYSSIYIFLTQLSTPFMASLPSSNKLFTILRSPHTDKKSREQFHLKYNTKVFRDTFNLCSALLYSFSGLLNSTLFVQHKKTSIYF